MKKLLIAGLVLVAAPLAAVAMPNVGDTVGTSPADATAALQTAGCVVQDFEAEGGSGCGRLVSFDRCKRR